jgi:hypothetical protein
MPDPASEMARISAASGAAGVVLRPSLRDRTGQDSMGEGRMRIAIIGARHVGQTLGRR